MWDKKGLKELISEKLKDNLFVVVSNREPYIHRYSKGNGIECIVPASGVVMALDPVLKACEGVWIAHGSGDADKKVVDEKNHISVPPEDPQYTLRRIWLNKAEENGYYYGFANETLWPLSHIVYTKPKFDESDWKYYKMVNERFAQAVLDEIKGKPAVVFVQDYHFTLVPRLIKAARPDVKVALFWHIPWPNSEASRICPWIKEILSGLLGADLLGFHIHEHVQNFLETVNINLEAKVNMPASSVMYKGIETLVRPYPISVDYEGIKKLAKSQKVKNLQESLKKELGITSQLIGISTDRLDYTKGIIERFQAIDRFFEKYPEYIGKISFVQAGVLSRIHIQRYKELNDEINALVEHINWKYSGDHWVPIILVRRHFNPIELLALNRLADICLISSLHDGMNLVAKEFVTSTEPGKGMLVLSKFTGAARELTGAVTINPYAPDSFADAIKEALEMPTQEKKRRNKKMKEQIAENNIYKWAGKIIEALLRLA